MNDYRLQFADEAAWWTAAASEGWVQHEYSQDEEPVIINSWVYALGVDFDVIGAIYKPTGNIINDAPEMAQAPGFHVNVRMHSGVLPQSLQANRVTPAQPVRTFAGGWFEGV